MEIVDLLDYADHLGEIILESEVVHEYIQARKRMNEDEVAKRLINEFNASKVYYEDVQRFGRYHPDYNKIMKEVRSKKREMDLNEHVAKFKIAERNLQKLLDDISEIIAHSVSTSIIVPKEDSLFTDSGCSSGSCGSGGSCSCNAS